MTREEKIKELFEEGMREPGKYFISTEAPGNETDCGDIDNMQIGGENGWDNLQELQEFVKDLIWDCEAYGIDTDVTRWHLMET